MAGSTAAVLPETPRSVPLTEAGQRIVLHGVSWPTYQRLLADFENSHAAHFAYDRGTLEIMVLSFKHETLNRVLAALVETVAEEMAIDIVNAGSTTFKRENLRRGFESDTSFYIQNADRVHGKDEIDLSVDPPPDLVIEIDITSPSLDKTPIYAAIGVPEIWRYDGNELTILRLDGQTYRTQDVSTALPELTNRVIARFIEESKVLKRTAWLRDIREWVNNR